MRLQIEQLRRVTLVLAAIALLQACQALSTGGGTSNRAEQSAPACARKVLTVAFSNSAFSDLSESQRLSLRALIPDLSDAPVLVLTGRARSRSVSASEKRALTMIDAVATELIRDGIDRSHIRRSVDLFQTGSGVDISTVAACAPEMVRS